LPTDRRFTGQREETSLGFYDYGARPYDPAQRQGGVLTYLHGDHLGSASLATNTSGAKITDSNTRYYPYGAMRPGLAGTGLPTDRRFTGQREETSLGFYDYGARPYDPAQRQGGVLTCLHGDHLGSASLATNASGAKITDSDTRYYPYGATRPGLAGTGLPTDRRFTGQREETSLGFYDYGARPYDPALGRFLQADTLVPESGNPQSLNRYAYTLDNPLGSGVMKRGSLTSPRKLL